MKIIENKKQKNSKNGQNKIKANEGHCIYFKEKDADTKCIILEKVQH